MLKKLAGVLFVLTFVISLSATSLAQDKAKPGRVEGRIVRSNKDKSTLTVSSVTMKTEVTVKYDPSTKWVSQYHGDKKVNTIDAGEVKDGDYVICRGTYGDKGEFDATTISKRLSHSPQ